MCTPKGRYNDYYLFLQTSFKLQNVNENIIVIIFNLFVTTIEYIIRLQGLW